MCCLLFFAFNVVYLHQAPPQNNNVVKSCLRKEVNGILLLNYIILWKKGKKLKERIGVYAQYEMELKKEHTGEEIIDLEKQKTGSGVFPHI